MAPRKLNLSNTALLNKATARASSLFAVDEDRTYRELTLSQIQVNANQPRKHFDPVELEALAASIDRHGLLQPIVVHEVGADRYEILAGERRYRAIGTTDEGRKAFVIFPLRHRNGAQRLRPISARYMHRKEVAAYEKAYPKL